MSNDIVMKAEHVSKKFCRSLKHVMLYGAKDIASNMAGLSSHSENLRNGEFWAVDDVSFELRRGETLGLIGPNGSGKSTMLKMINGIFMPDKGSIEIKGRVGALIEIGAGFHPMLTGRENIYVNGAILGMGKKEIDRRFDEIVDFADIGDFIESPVKHYSSGMHVRLGFAIAAHCEPEILLVDEVLSVGDFSFQRKCMDRIDLLMEKGMSIVFVSHNLQVVDNICSRAVYFDKGDFVFLGPASEAIRLYQNNQKKKMIASGHAFKSVEEQDAPDGKDTLSTGFATPNYESGEVELLSVEIFDAEGEPKDHFSFDEKMIVKVRFMAKKRLENPVYCFGIFRDDGIHSCGGRSVYNGIKIDSIEGEGGFELEFEKIQLNSGAYIFSIIIFDKNMRLPYMYQKMGEFTVESMFPKASKNPAVFIPDIKWKIDGPVVKKTGEYL